MATDADMRRVEEAAKNIRNAFKGIGTDEDKLIGTITSFDNEMRQLIKLKYMSMYGRRLEEDAKSELSGEFLDAVLALLMPKDEYEARCLKTTFDGFGTNEQELIELVCTKDGKEIRTMASTYKQIFHRDVDKDLVSETSGYLCNVLRAILSGGRAENHGFDIELVRKEAVELYKAGKGRIGTDEDEFIRILCSRSFPQLLTTFAIYNEWYKVTLADSIESEMSGDLRDACSTIVKCVQNRPAYFADLIHETMKGLGTNEKKLMRLLISRSNVDLKEIKAEYKKKYNKTLYDAVKSELGGDFQKLMLALIGKN